MRNVYDTYNNQVTKSDINSRGESVQPYVNARLSPLVEARLDLPISRNLLGKFSMSVIRRSWERQLTSKSKIKTFFNCL